MKTTQDQEHEYRTVITKVDNIIKNGITEI